MEDAIEYAMENSLAIEKAKLDKEQGLQSLAEGIASLLPNLRSSSSTNSMVLDSLGKGMWRSNVSLSQPVLDASVIFSFLGGFQNNASAQAQSRQKIARLILDVERAYYNLAKSQALSESAEQKKLRAQENFRIVVKKFELGAANKAEKLRAESFLLTAETEILNTHMDIENKQRVFADLLGLDEYKNIKVENLPLPENPDSLSSTVVSMAMLESNPDFEVLKKQVSSSNLAYWGAWGTILPSLSFDASKNFAQNGPIPDLSQWKNTPTTYGLSLSFSFIDIKGRALAINRARLRRKEAIVNFAQQKLVWRQRLASLIAAQEVSYKNWEAAGKNLELSREVYRLSAKRHELGSQSLADLLQVGAELATAERSYVETLAAYWSSRAELNYFLGTNLQVLAEDR